MRPRLLVFDCEEERAALPPLPSVRGTCRRSCACRRAATTDSTWITSAPSAASMPVADGPAHHAVRSTTLTPSSGRRCDRVAGAGRTGRPRPRRRGATVDGVLAEPGAGPRAARELAVDPPRPAGHRERAGGVVDEHAADARRDRASSTARPSHTGATGMRSTRGPLDDLGGRVPASSTRARCRSTRPTARHAWRSTAHSASSSRSVRSISRQERVELLAGVGVEADVAVERRLDRRRLERAGRAASGRAGPAPQRVDEVGESRAGERATSHGRDVDEPTRSAVAARRAARRGRRRRRRGR